MPTVSLRLFMVLLLVGTLLGHHGAAAEPEFEESQTEIPSFFLREVTGPKPNLAKCLVCQYGRRPVVLLCVRELNDETKNLIEKIDRVVDAHRGEGLRGFAIFVDADAKTIQPKLFNLARERKLSLPLTLPVEPAGPSALAVSKAAAVTVILYRDVKEERRFELHDDLTAEAIDEIAAAAAEMVKSEETSP